MTASSCACKPSRNGPNSRPPPRCTPLSRRRSRSRPRLSPQPADVTFDPSAPGPQLVAPRDVDPAPAPAPGHCFRVVADGAGTGGAYILTEATSPAGAGVPFHAHDHAVECFYVLDGRYRLTVSGAEHEAG